MSDFFNPATTPRAAKPHQCISCSFRIEKGEVHRHQTGNYDGRWYSNRFHEECWQALAEDGDFEFTPGEGEPPERLRVVGA